MHNKVSRSVEDAWFSQNEAELLKKIKERHEKEKIEREKAEHEEARRKLKEAHWMKCPKCGHDMEEVSIDGIDIDKCKECDGIYFDAGELDDLLLKKQNGIKSFFKGIFKIEMEKKR